MDEAERTAARLLPERPCKDTFAEFARAVREFLMRGEQVSLREWRKDSGRLEHPKLKDVIDDADRSSFVSIPGGSIRVSSTKEIARVNSKLWASTLYQNEMKEMRSDDTRARIISFIDSCPEKFEEMAAETLREENARRGDGRDGGVTVAFQEAIRKTLALQSFKFDDENKVVDCR